MAGNYRFSSASVRAVRRDRHKPYTPVNRGKPTTRDAGTRTGAK